MSNLLNIEFKKINSNPTIDCETSLYELPFYKDVEYFSNIDNFVTFVKACERMIRSSNYYKRYISYLKNDLGLKRCQVLSNIEEVEDGDELIEMHHGPILTLFDTVSIIVDAMLYENKKINTFTVSDLVMKEHFEHNVQVVFLSSTVHQMVHDGKIFINLKQAFGNIERFIEKYRHGVHPEHIEKINKYIDTSLMYDSFDNDVLKLAEKVRDWK